MDKNSKDKSLEGVRGLAAVIVLIAHFLAAFQPNAVFGSADPSWSEVFYKTPLGIIAAGNFAVCLFFIMSGYVLSLKHLTQATRDIEIYGDILKRYIRLGLPLVATALISFLTYKHGFYYNNEVAKVIDNKWFGEYFNMLENKTYLSFVVDTLFQIFPTAKQYNPPAWTITTELIGSYLTFIIVIITRYFRYRFLIYVIVFVLLSGDFLQNFILGLAVGDAKVNFENWAKKVPKLISKQKILKSLTINGIFYLSLVLASYPYYVPVEILVSSDSFYQGMSVLNIKDFLGGGITLLSGLLFFITYQYTIYEKILQSGLMQMLGKYSFMIYLTHFLTLSSISSFIFLQTMSMDKLTNLGLTFGTYIFSTILLTILLEKFVDIPAIKLSSHLKYFYLSNIN